MNVITKDCPIECLASVLSPQTFTALAEGLTDCPATVGQVVELYEQGRLMRLHNINSGRLGEIRRGLVAAELIPATVDLLGRRQEAGEQDAHHESCPLHGT